MGTFSRTLAIGKYRGWLSVRPIAKRNAPAGDAGGVSLPALPRILGKLRRMFDLDARPDQIAAPLWADVKLAGLVNDFPGADCRGR